MAVFYLFLAAIGIWWLILFTRPSVMLQFSGGRPVADEGGRPLSITLIAWLLLLSALSAPFGLLARMPTILMGFLLTGCGAALTYASLLIVLLYLGIGLLRLKPLARTLTVYYSIFAIVNMAFFCLRSGYESRMSALMSASSSLFHSSVPPMVFPPLPFLVLTVATMGVQIYFLVTRKGAFERPPANPSPSLS
jgi:hypothetical protein